MVFPLSFSPLLFFPDSGIISLVDPGRGLLLNHMANPTAPKIPNIPPVQFVKEVVAELKKVTWPTRQETVKLTAVVIAISLIVGVFIGFLDISLLKITSLLFK